MKIAYRYQLIIAFAVIALIALLIIVLAIVPLLRVLPQIDADVAEADIGRSQAAALLAQRQAMKSRSAETEATRLRLANQIPENPELPTLIIELQDTINAAGLEFASISPNPPVQVGAEPYSAISIAVVVRGSWQDTVDMLQRIRGLTRQVRIVSFSVTHLDDADDDAPNQVETAIGLEVYTMPAEVAPVTDVPPPAEEAQ